MLQRVLLFPFPGWFLTSCKIRTFQDFSWQDFPMENVFETWIDYCLLCFPTHNFYRLIKHTLYIIEQESIWNILGLNKPFKRTDEKMVFTLIRNPLPWTLVESAGAFWQDANEVIKYSLLHSHSMALISRSTQSIRISKMMKACTHTHTFAHTPHATHTYTCPCVQIHIDLKYLK